MQQIFTASWFTPLPDTINRIGISRGTPRRQPAGYRILSALAPGAWFNSVPLAEYVERYYGEILHFLDPIKIRDQLEEMGAESTRAWRSYASSDHRLASPPETGVIAA